MIKATLLTVYLYGLLPFLIGVCICVLSNRRRRLSFAYVSGYLVYLSFFEVLVLFSIRRKDTYSKFVEKWSLLVCALSAITVLCIILCILLVARRSDEKFIRPIIACPCSRENRITILITITLTIVAIVFFVPHAFDDTPEFARLVLATDTLWQPANESFTFAAEKPSSLGYLYLYYAYGSTLTGIDVTTLIHLIMPLFMLPFFVCVYVQISMILLPENKHQKQRFCFVWLVMLFYLLMLPLDAHIALAPYRNIWNGITLASSCLIPLFITFCIALSRQLLVCKKKLCWQTLFSFLERVSMEFCSSPGFWKVIFSDIILSLIYSLWNKRSR